MEATHIRLGRAELELNETNLGLLHTDRSIGILQDSLGKDESIDQLAIFDRSSDLLDDSDVLKIDIIGGLHVDGLGN